MKKQNNVGAGPVSAQRGITLIALIITIIVMLILAGVTINLTLGENGIFTTAQKAAQNYTDAQNKELAELNNFSNLLNNTINGLGQEENAGATVAPEIKVTGITLNKTSTTIAVNETETLTATILPENATNKKLIWTSSDETVATVTNGKITALKVGNTTITATTEDGSRISANCTVTVTYPTLASKAKPGDYVEYDGGNGYTGLWQVLYNDSTYGLQIISADTVTDSFTLGSDTDDAKAKADYNDAINILNNECRKYINTSYASSARCIGSNPLSPDVATTDTFTLEFPYNGSTASGMKVADTNYEADYNAMKAATNQNTVGIHNLGKNYWLASRNVIADSSGGNFYVRAVLTNGDTDIAPLWYVYPSNNTNPCINSFAIRPVITLKSDIQTSSGTGSESSAFKLVAK